MAKNGWQEGMAVTDEQLIDLLHRLAKGYVYAFPRGTVGGEDQYKRARRPQVGDFVMVSMAPGLPDVRMGKLTKIEPPLVPESERDPHCYTREFIVECLDGIIRRWSNCQITSLPVGNLFEFGKEFDCE